jgi:hypothetical protein
MLPNEVFALACRAYYDEQGLIVDETNGEFAHCPLPRGMGDKGYYLLWEHHQQQGLLQSRDLGKCCFFSGDVKEWLLTCSYWPDNFFELWDIYDEYVSRPKPQEVREKTRQSVKRMWDELSQEERDMRAQNIRNALQSQPKEVRSKRSRKGGKPLEVTFPNGRVGTYPSISFAQLATGIGHGTLSFWARKEEFEGPRNRKFEGYFARYV